MNVPLVLQRHRSLRWIVPAGVLVVAGLAASGVFSSSASSKTLPTTTPAALVAAVRTPTVTGFSGTVVSRVSIGLPEIPTLGSSKSASLGSLLTGSHTLQVWYGGPQHQRIALLGATDETDMFRAGKQFWEWNSATRTAVHAHLRKHGGWLRSALPTPIDPASATPSGLAGSLLSRLAPTTKVRVEHDRTVADRPAYDLVLEPRTSASRIGSVHIAIDGATKIPLDVQIFPRGSSRPAVDVGFTSISLHRPSIANFHFSPPSGAVVHSLKHTLSQPLATLSGGGRPRVIGTGWTRILELQADRRLGGHALREAGLDRALVPVSGKWGKGHLLQTNLLDVLICRGGRIFAGPVNASALYAAAAHH